MTDTPERIWMDMDQRGKPFVTQGYLASPPRTEYIRADVADAEIQKLKQRLSNLLHISGVVESLAESIVEELSEADK